VGNRVSENIPRSRRLIERSTLQKRGRGAGGWTRSGCLLIGTRSRDVQAHRVCQPLGMREQLTFYPEPARCDRRRRPRQARTASSSRRTRAATRFSQLYWFDADTREVALLTDGKRTQTPAAVLARRPRARLPEHCPQRHDTDVCCAMRRRPVAALVTEAAPGRRWTSRPTAAAAGDEVRLGGRVLSGEVELDTGKLRMFPVDGGKASFGASRMRPTAGRSTSSRTSR